MAKAESSILSINLITIKDVMVALYKEYTKWLQEIFLRM